MTLIKHISELISTSSGGLIYHVSLLFVIKAALALALGRGQRPVVRRLALSASGMLLARFALIVVTFLELQGAISHADAILPPLERAVDTLGSWLLVWSLLPLFNRRPRWSMVLAGFIIMSLMLLYLVLARNWYFEAINTKATYNAGTHETVWEVIQLVILGAAATHSLIDRRGDWGLRFGILFVLVGAHCIHFGWATRGENVAGWIRLGQLVAYPLFTLSVYRIVVRGQLPKSGMIATGPDAERVEWVRLLSEIANADREQKTIRATLETIAAFTGANHAGFVAIQPESELNALGSDSRIELRAMVLLTDKSEVPRVRVFLQREQLGILHNAMSNNRAVLLKPGAAEDSIQREFWKQLFANNMKDGGLSKSLLIQPVLDKDTGYGVLVVALEASPSRMATHLEMVELLAAQVAAALAHTHDQTLLEEQALHVIDLENLAAEAKGQISDMEVLTQQMRVRIEMLEEEVSLPELEPESLDIEPRYASDSSNEKTAIASATRENLYQMAQEIAQTVSAVSGYADLLLDGSSGTMDELPMLLLQRIKASVERAELLLDDIHKLVAPETARFQLVREPVDVVKMVHDNAQSLVGRINENSINLELELNESIPLLEMDRNATQKIIYHLFENAVAATPREGRVSVEVTFQPIITPELIHEPQRGYLFIIVSDSGAGIELDDQFRVFNPHYRAEHSEIEGLGDPDSRLPLVRDLVQAHGGRIWIESEIGNGSIFRSVFPVKVAFEDLPLS